MRRACWRNLSDRLNKVLRYLRGEVKITEENMQQALKEIRMSLLEADVNFKVVKKFIENVRDQAMGREVHESLNPTQQVIKIVQAELTAMLGSENRELNRARSSRPSSCWPACRARARPPRPASWPCT